MAAECYGPEAVLGAMFGSLDTVCLATLRNGVVTSRASAGAYGVVFLLTCALEAPVYGAASRWRKLSRGAWARQTFALNMATHPVVFWLIPRVLVRGHASTLATILVSEVFAPVVEAGLLVGGWGYPWRVAAGVAITANLFSWWSGQFLHPALVSSLNF